MRAALVLVPLLASASLAEAQPISFGESHFVGETPVDVVVRWRDRAGRPRGTVEVRAGGRAIQVHRGGPAYAWAATNERGALVALVGASASVDVVFVPLIDGRPRAARRASIRRIGSDDRSPVGAAVAARPEGFAVFWQEASLHNPGAVYDTFVADFDADGRARGEPHRVHAPWPIADVTWLPATRQYYFLLYFGGSDPSGTRLCGVHVDAQAQRNLEHPFWVSRAGLIDEARLIVRGDRVLAYYRDDSRLREADVTQGSWGRDPASPPREHGPLANDVAFGLRPTADGVELRRVPTR